MEEIGSIREENPLNEEPDPRSREKSKNRQKIFSARKGPDSAGKDQSLSTPSSHESTYGKNEKLSESLGGD